MDRNHSAKICARGTGLRKRSHGCAEGALIEPHPAIKRLGRPRETELRGVFDGILYLARTGCQWRMLRKDFPSFTTVEGNFCDWRDDGLFEKINFALLLQARDVAGREASRRLGFRHLFATASPTGPVCGRPPSGSATGSSRPSNAPRTLLAFDYCQGDGSSNEPQPPPGKGFRGVDREQSVSLHHLCAATHQAISLTLT